MAKLDQEQQDLRLAVFGEVHRMCTDLGQKMDASFERNSIRLLAELTWKRLETWGQDLEHFAKHDKRSTVNAEDVKLLVRRHAKLKEHISNIAEKNKVASKEGKKRQSKESEKEKNQEDLLAVPGPSNDAVLEVGIIDEDNDLV